MTTFTIHGKPFAKQRPRFSRRTGVAYTPGQTVSFERAVGVVAEPHFPEPIEGPVAVSVTAIFEIPKSWPKKRQAAAEGGPHTQRPDLDNIQKAISDGLNRIAYADDAQIASFNVAKFWGRQARTVVTVEPFAGRLPPEGGLF